METKPGFLTTEFWITLIGYVISLLNILGVWNWASNWHSGILMTVLSAFYALARGQAKQGVAYDPTVRAHPRR